ncbi:hypothetical protein BCR34DRAFT_567224 [Clohesyomyces aquaticus]|uniref:Uncharacterized protein n=1 Tax=Clohesyomyces aquaticus TaxID=1231657 RepID=A0A1Y1ZIZ9_9PLEO|nr:hypothetical protein BCR34DRAFT_567224 [Clohesyomyces aquaticus]
MTAHERASPASTRQTLFYSRQELPQDNDSGNTSKLQFTTFIDQMASPGSSGSPQSNTPNPSAISAQWQLNETANSGITIAKGVLRAATSDNVQPIAIISADAFGATLAMCQEAQLRVERAAIKDHTSYVVEFLRSSIGYAKDDCAIQLASSHSGLRFLGLAATLICMADTFTASQALELMITSSAARGQILPSTSQLQHLLVALEHKLNRIGFAESVIGWETFITEHPAVPDKFRIFNRMAIDHPSKESMRALVDAFRNLDRLGSATSIEIKAGTCCPWVVAFTKWCLGEPPNIVLQNGTVLIGESQTAVTVVVIMSVIEPVFGREEATRHIDTIVMEAREVEFEITVYRDLLEPRQLWSEKHSGAQQKPWHGMVTVESYGKRRLKEYGLIDNKAFRQAIHHSVKLVTSTIQAHHPRYRPLRQEFGGTLASGLRHENERMGPLPSDLATYKSTIFPADHDLRSTLCNFLGIQEDDHVPLPQLDKDSDLMSLPLVEIHVRKLKERCKCERCSGDLGEQLAECRITDFIDVLTQLTAEVIALSLFDCTEPILVHAGGARLPGTKALDRNDFIAATELVIRGAISASCTVAEIWNLALTLVGHNAGTNLKRRTWIASASRGQVMYPQIFDSAIIETRSVLKLGGGPGKLFHEGSSYKFVCGETERQWNAAAKSTVWINNPVDRPLNLVPNDSLEWQIRKGDDTLHLTCGTTSLPKVFEPHWIVESLAQSVFLRSCAHPESRVLEKPDKYSFYITPYYSNIGHGSVRIFEGRVGIVAVADNDGLRLFALSCGSPGVIRGKACIKCCLDLCRLAGFEYVIL